MVKNTSYCGQEEPFTYQYFADPVKTPLIIILAIGSALVALMLFLFAEACFFFHRRLTESGRRERSLWILSLFPVLSTISLIALFIPRSAQLISLLSSLYISIILYQFLLLIIHYFGGPKAALALLEGERLPLAGVPCCCCLCLPTITIHRQSLLWLKRGVLQVILVSPLAIIAAVILETDGQYHSGLIQFGEPYIYIALIRGMSALLAVYSLRRIHVLAENPLKKFYIKPKFSSVAITLLLSNIQPILINILTKFNIFPCEPPFTTATIANGLENFLIICEMSLLNILAWYFFRRNTGNIEYNTDCENVEIQLPKEITDNSKVYHLENESNEIPTLVYSKEKKSIVIEV